MNSALLYITVPVSPAWRVNSISRATHLEHVRLSLLEVVARPVGERHFPGPARPADQPQVDVSVGARERHATRRDAHFVVEQAVFICDRPPNK